MSMYPVTIHEHILINHYDGQPYLFWNAMGGGHALVNQEDCREQIGMSARKLVADYLDGNMTTYLTAKVEIHPDSFEIVRGSVSLNDKYTFNDRPRSLEGETPQLAMDYANIRENYQ